MIHKLDMLRKQSTGLTLCSKWIVNGNAHRNWAKVTCPECIKLREELRLYQYTDSQLAKSKPGHVRLSFAQKLRRDKLESKRLSDITTDFTDFYFK